MIKKFFHMETKEELFTVIKDEKGKLCLYITDVNLDVRLADEYWEPILDTLTIRHKENVIYHDSEGKIIEGKAEKERESLRRVIGKIAECLGKREEYDKYFFEYDARMERLKGEKND